MEQKDTRKLIKEAIDEMIAGNSVVTLSDLDKLAEEGGGAAMYWMSKRYKHGFPISSIDPKTGRKTTAIHYDNDKAERLLQQSAELGYPPAQCYLGIRHDKAKEYDKAFTLFKSAAEQDFVFAMYRLGLCYFYGLGVEQDHKEGIRWGKKVAEAGFSKAEYWFAGLVESGYDIDNDSYNPTEPDMEKAIFWLTKAAEHDNTSAQYDLGIRLLEGRGTEKNEQEGIEWLKKSANNSLKAAMDKLEELGVTWKEEKDNTTKTESES